ncbi:MAG TPA: hypothetical protein VLZ28_00485, partial [Daejeonella sp.]|nr:hypothetical protein [Daejeonella sp.]
MKNIYTIVLFILLPCLVYSQSNYTEGLVITHNSDTLKGFIDYQEWVKNPEKITFKTSLSAAEQVFTESDIVYFEVFDKEEAYQRFIT